MKPGGPLHNGVKAARLRMGLSQQELAARTGVTRQTISGVESGLFAPSTTVALHLAQVLGCRVEDLFWLEEAEPASVAAVPAGDLPAGVKVRLALAQVGGRWVARPLLGDDAFRTELVPADGTGLRAAGAERVQVRLFDRPEHLAQTVLLAGCSPEMSLWARAAERTHPGLRVQWLFANSMDGLERLRRGEVHAAGVHLYDPVTGEHNTPFVRRLLPDRNVVLVNLGTWEEGLLVPPGNPLGLHSAADLAQPGITVVNREPGAGARLLLEQSLQAAGVPSQAVAGFDREVLGHLEVARAVALGQAAAGVSTAAVAAAFGLGFVPLRRVRYDIVVPRAHLEEPPVQQLLGTLGHRWVWSQLAALGGYDTSRTGETVATLGPASSA